MKKILIITFSCILALSSCSDFLDMEPTNQSSANKSVASVSDAQVFMNGIMRNMTSSSYYGRNMMLYADAKGGDLCIGGRGRGYEQLYTFNHNPNSSSYVEFWSRIYNCILEANTLIQNIDKLIEEGNDTDKLNEIKAQALTARALFYYDLVRLYGKPYDMDKKSLGVPLELSPLDYNAQPLRASVEEVYEQILKDLKEAEAFLKPKKNNGYINYYANIAIQARVELQMQNYNQALIKAEEIINSNAYKLYTNEEWVESWAKQFASESIFELIILSSEGDLKNLSLGSMTINSKHTEAKWDYFIASDGFLNLLGQDATDIRWGVMDIDEKSTEENIRKGCCYKYLGGINIPGDGEGKETTTAVNIKIIRLSEIYLIAAEAALQADKNKAANYLNEIRKRAPALEPATAATVNIDMIIEERSKELITEGHRFFDMMRLNKSITFDDEKAQSEITSRPQTINRQFHKTILPISLDEINANPNLKSQQNPEY